MQICIHRGSKEIGGSCVELACQGKYLILDYGLPLDAGASDKSLIPDIHRDGLLGVIISHPHLDHYGLLPYLPEGIPVLMGKSARQIIRATLPFLPKKGIPRLEGMDIEHRKPFQMGPFRITPYLVDHSAFDAYSFLIEANGKRLFYTGDFRAHGRKFRLFESFLKHPPSNTDVLLMEGSSLSRLEENTRFPTESEMEIQLAESFRHTGGLVMVHVSGQNIDRIVSIYRACKRTGRTMVIDLYTAAVLEATGHSGIPQSSWENMALYVPEAQRRLVKRNGMFDLLEKHSRHRIFREHLQKSPSRYVLLFRPLMINDLDNPALLEKAGFIFSQWHGYLEKGTYPDMETWLRKYGIPIKEIHTSGHADPLTLKRFAEALAPKALVPIHSFAPEKYRELFAHVVYRHDGEWWDIPTLSTFERKNMATPIRKLSPDFMNALQDGILHPLLTQVQQDDSLSLFIRKDYINIYFRGGNLLKLSKNKKDSYAVGFDKNYDPEKRYIDKIPDTLDNEEKVTRLIDMLPHMKQLIDRHRTTHPKMEREFQQLVARENNYSKISNETDYFIIDIEADYRNIGRFDFVACKWPRDKRKNDNVQLVLMEMKYGNGALKGTAGLVEHVKAIEKLLSDPQKAEILCKTAEAQLNQLNELRLLKHTRPEERNFRISPDLKPELILLLANHNPYASSLSSILDDSGELKHLIDQNSERFDSLFFTSCAAGYGMQARCMLPLEAFRKMYFPDD